MSRKTAEVEILKYVGVLNAAFTKLSIDCSQLEVERLASRLQRSIDSSNRYYHKSDHVLEVAEDKDPILSLAGLYHDLVQNKIDKEVPSFVDSILKRHIIFYKNKTRSRFPNNKIATFGYLTMRFRHLLISAA